MTEMGVGTRINISFNLLPDIILASDPLAVGTNWDESTQYFGHRIF